MGAGASSSSSSLHRLRKAILIRAYNARKRYANHGNSSDTHYDAIYPALTREDTKEGTSGDFEHECYSWYRIN